MVKDQLGIAMQKSINQIEQEWYELFQREPIEILKMLAALLAVQGIELDEDQETTTPDTPSEGDQVSEQPVSTPSVDGGGNE